MTSLAPLQAAMRRAGLDPLGVEIVALGLLARAVPASLAVERAVILTAAAAARVEAFSGSRPQHLRPVLPPAVSRRSLFALSWLEYQVVPAARADRCRADAGCALCVLACPHQALEATGGEIRLLKLRCTSCAVCVTACPHDAMEFPGFTAAEMDARTRALLDPLISPLQPRAILLSCAGSPALPALAGGIHPIPASWLPLEVPCAEMVPARWLLAFLARGAAAVGVVPCPNGCRTGGPGRIEGRVAFCRQLLARMGESEPRILTLPAEPAALARVLRQPLPGPGPGDPALPGAFAAGAAAQLLQHLARAYDAETVAVSHPFSPFGVLDVRDGCTLCGACAAVCPTGALALQRDEDEILIVDPARCVACGQCLPACPEPDVLHLGQVADLGRLAAGRTEVRRSRQRRCAACGAPIAPETMLQRIGVLLGDQHARARDVIARYCQDCRAASMSPI
ncbi:MAG: 4Fe-4S binding protein [Armatimonadota bacterium]|nr:4Fe-4S binding protein [Armatimonadota bacterium]MDR7500108.1 4Fe-4S binding protein [Armatimonadota bacterium]MDR7505712.1 4Fe-4S binding protein [Armatimonadota bacterium]MDR7545669.1 4Fe-4S binding protein [Armatimonadota bacterium]MDR7553710.1 4Fe-4S binding protein [Armatimonadota bacterium]